MKKLLFAAICCLFYAMGFAQQALPAKVYSVLQDSITNIDITVYKAGSLSMEGKNARSFDGFFQNTTTAKTNLQPEGMIMWQINGREYLSGKFFLGDSIGYVVTTFDNKEYINVIGPEGNKFFKERIIKK